MLNEYLQFTSSNFSEKNEIFNISLLMDEIIHKYENKNISKDIIGEIYINGRKNLLGKTGT